MKPQFTWINPCKHCPSHWYTTDPECKDLFANETRDYAQKTAFACAWRPKGYCYGLMWKIYEEYGTPLLEKK